jgi:hypothetical protein
VIYCLQSWDVAFLFQYSSNFRFQVSVISRVLRGHTDTLAAQLLTCRTWYRLGTLSVYINKQLYSVLANKNCSSFLGKSKHAFMVPSALYMGKLLNALLRITKCATEILKEMKMMMGKPHIGSDEGPAQPQGDWNRIGAHPSRSVGFRREGAKRSRLISQCEVSQGLRCIFKGQGAIEWSEGAGASRSMHNTPAPLPVPASALCRGNIPIEAFYIKLETYHTGLCANQTSTLCSTRTNHRG